MEEKMVSNEMSLSNMVLGFFEELEGKKRWDSEDGCGGGGVSDDEGEGSSGGGGDAAECKAFWAEQHQLLQEALAKTSSAESRIFSDTEKAIKKMQSASMSCSCKNRASKDCRNCTLGYIAEQLREIGYNSALCKSKWTRSPDTPPGEHSYVDVMVDTKSGKSVRVVIELNFRPEFEMARASQEYKSLVDNLPGIFVGKSEKLKNVVKIMCAAAKRCMKDNNMHMGPWRKHKYMQSKWLGTPERVGTTFSVPAATSTSERQPKFKASMLTFDLHRKAVAVV